MLVIRTIRELRQEDCHKFETSLGYIISSRQLGIHNKTLFLKQKKTHRLEKKGMDVFKNSSHPDHPGYMNGYQKQLTILTILI